MPLPPAKISACINLFSEDNDKTKKNIVKNQSAAKCRIDAKGFNILKNLKTSLCIAFAEHSGKNCLASSLKNYL